MLNVLVACEESQAVCTEFRRLGHRAFSCDLQDCSGGHPEWHIKQDVLPILNGNCFFATQDKKIHRMNGKWDLIIAHPPCTHLAVSGARHFEKKREDGRQLEGIELFCKFLEADCEHIAVENPVNIISGDYITQYFPEVSKRHGLPIKPSQAIQPYEYGDPFRKTTNLWLKGLCKLTPTDVVEPNLVTYECSDGKKVTFSADYGGGGEKGAKRRSKTYHGIAKAMAEQWSEYIENKER